MKKITAILVLLLVITVFAHAGGRYAYVGDGVQKGGGVFDVRAYNAVGDDSTDDTTAIQSAITAAAVSGGTVIIPPGTYKITDQLALASDVAIIGYGHPRIKQYTADKRLFYLDTLNDVVISGLEMEGLGAADVDLATAPVEIMVYMVNCTKVIIEDCYLTGAPGQTAIYLAICSDVKILNNEINDVTYQGIGIVGDSQRIYIRDNYIHDCFNDRENGGGGYGIILSYGTDSLYPSYVWIEDNRIENFMQWDGINAHGGEHLYIRNNVTKNCSYGIEVSVTYVDENSSLRDVRITGNSVYGITANASMTAATIAFVDSDPDTITDSGSAFVSNGFAAGDWISVQDSNSNDGVYHIASIVAGTITLDSDVAVTGEVAGANITVTTDVGVTTGTGGIHVTGTPTKLAEDIFISDNYVTQVCWNAKTTQRPAIRVNYTEGLIINGNHVYDNNISGIAVVTRVFDFVISNNIVQNCNSMGIYPGYSQIENGMIVGNLISDRPDGTYSTTHAFGIGTAGLRNVREHGNQVPEGLTRYNTNTAYYLQEYAGGGFAHTESRAGTILRVEDASIYMGGGSGWVCTNREDTAMREPAAAAATTMEVDDTTGMAVNDKVGILLSCNAEGGNTEAVKVDFSTSSGAAEGSMLAVKFACGGTDTMNIYAVGAILGKTGTNGDAPAGTIQAAIYTDDSGLPDEQTGVTSDTVTCTDLDASGAYQEFTFSRHNAPRLTAGTDYWIVFDTSGYTYSDGVTEVWLYVDANGVVGGTNKCATYDSDTGWDVDRHAQLTGDDWTDHNLQMWGTWHWTSVDSVTDGDTVEIGDGLPATYAAGVDNDFVSMAWDKAIRSQFNVGATWDPPSVGAGSFTTKTITATGATTQDFAVASFSIDLLDLVLDAQINTAGVVECVLINNTAGAVDLAEGILRVIIFRL